MSEKIEVLKEELRRLEIERDNFEVSDYVSNDDYDNWIDEIEGDVTIGGISYSASYALSEIDPIAYRCGFSDYCEGIEKEKIKEYRDILEKIEEIEEEIEDLEEEEEEEENDN